MASSKGNRCIVVTLEHDSDHVLVEPMRNRMTGKILCMHHHLMDRLEARSIFPMHQVLDNEVSAECKHQTTAVNEMTCQLALPGDHQRNTAEEAAQVFKDHFVANMCGMDP